MKKYIKSASASPVTLEVMYDPYMRYETKPTRHFKVKGNDLLEALKKMCDKMSLYITSDDIEEEVMTPEEVIDRIYEENGDGCDFVMFIKNLTTGEMLLEENYDPDMEDDI